MIEPGFTAKASVTLKKNPKIGIHHLFEQVVVSTPDNIAVIFKNTSLTYKELNEKANRLAYYLKRNYTISIDEPVGIILDRSELMIIGLLAILKAGGAYLPIDPNGNIERSNFICKDASLKIILCDNAVNADQFSSKINFINIAKDSPYDGEGENLSNTLTEDNAAYVIYTSGTTGNPKGVIIKHYSLINFVNSFFKQFSVHTDDVFLQMSSFYFDASIMELFVPLSFGSRIVFLEPGMHKYPEKICDAVGKHCVSMLFFTPAMLQVFLDYLLLFDDKIDTLKKLRRVITGGDTLSPKLANLFNKVLYNQTKTILTNIYGPTEATVWVTTWDCDAYNELKHIPIGKPIENTEIYIVDGNNKIVETGQTGELVIGGTPVAKEYLNRPELNTEKFIPNPYYPGEKMYKTGDKAKYLADGNIYFLGRIDNQVKLNGFRIELGEVENALLKNNHIKECVVLMKNVSEVNELVAYFTLINDNVDETNLIEQLVEQLKLSLPDYMVPAFYCKMDIFPINSNGKIDKKNLPANVTRHYKPHQQFESPSSDTEKKLSEIFQQQLKIKKIGINDNLFELGVRSLIVTKIIIEIDMLLNKKISLAQFFQFPTIRELAGFVDNNPIENSNPFTLIRTGEGDALFLLPGLPGNPLNYSNFVKNYPINQPIYSIVIENTNAPTVKTQSTTIIFKTMQDIW